jgi:hypothetical protein
MVLACLNFFSPIFKQGLLHYNYILYSLMAFTGLFTIYRPIYAVIIDKPILTVDESYIYDFNNDIKYDWKDIEKIYKKGRALYIKLYKPKDYLDKIGNPHRRFITRLWFKPNSKRSLFYIETNLAETNGNELLDILEKFRKQALSIENS